MDFKDCGKTRLSNFSFVTMYSNDVSLKMLQNASLYGKGRTSLHHKTTYITNLDNEYLYLSACTLIVVFSFRFCLTWM